MKTSTLNWRRKGRLLVLQMLYEVDCTGHDPVEILDRTLKDHALSEQAVSFIRDLFSKISENKDSIDNIIRRFASAWPFEQIALVDRNILRMGVHEIISGETPVKVAINESIELAKAFGSNSSSKFINGVLGAVYTEISNLKN